MWTRKQDGRTREWFGRVWLNPPFDYQLPVFVKLMADHNNGVALLPVNLTSKWWKGIIWTRAHSILFLFEKLHFYRGKKQDMTPRSHMDRSEALVAFGAKNTLAIKRSGIGGQLVFGSRA
jgi:hypothetical protein